MPRGQGFTSRRAFAFADHGLSPSHMSAMTVKAFLCANSLTAGSKKRSSAASSSQASKRWARGASASATGAEGGRRQRCSRIGSHRKALSIRKERNNEEGE